MRSILLMMMLAAGTDVLAEAAPPDPTLWIMNLPTDQDRFEAIQKYLRGFDQPMWEVGERYQAVYQAIRDSNYPLALYHWNKIKTTIENGYMKRPARRANSDALFLAQAWPDMTAALESGKADRVRAGFAAARTACMGCHDAEKVPYMNDQPLFRDLVME